MAFYVNDRAVWSRDDLARWVLRHGKILTQDERFRLAEWTDGPVAGALYYVAYSDCFTGDPRDPDHHLEGPFREPDLSLVRGRFDRWIAVMGDPLSAEEVLASDDRRSEGQVNGTDPRRCSGG